MTKEIFRFLFAFNCGLYSFLIAIWIWMTYKFLMYKYVNGYLWGLFLVFIIGQIILNSYWFFSEEKLKSKEMK